MLHVLINLLQPFFFPHYRASNALCSLMKLFEIIKYVIDSNRENVIDDIVERWIQLTLCKLLVISCWQCHLHPLISSCLELAGLSTHWNGLRHRRTLSLFPLLLHTSNAQVDLAWARALWVYGQYYRQQPADKIKPCFHHSEVQFWYKKVL